MVSLFSILCSCCSCSHTEGKDDGPDETSRLIPVLVDPSPSSTSPQPDHINQQVVQERLGDIVRNTRGKMVNVTAPPDAQHQIWRNVVDVGAKTQPEHVNGSGGQREGDGDTEWEGYENDANKPKSRSSSPSRNPTQATPTDAFQLQGVDALSISWGPAD